MSGPLERLRRLIAGAGDEVSVSKAALSRYLQCVDEWNSNYFDDEWCDSPRGQTCTDYIDWFNEHYGE